MCVRGNGQTSFNHDLNNMTDSPTHNPSSHLHIVVHEGALAGKTFSFTAEHFTVGRAEDNDIVIDEVQVSRHHATLRRDGNEVTLEDLGSTNGTLVNGEIITEPHILQPTEKITIGTSVFKVAGFSAPVTVGMSVPVKKAWRTYHSSENVAPQITPGRESWLLWGGLTILLVLVIGLIGSGIFLFILNQPILVDSKPFVVISSPLDNSQFYVNQRIIVQATATDEQGVTRMELHVGGEKVNDVFSVVETGESPFTGIMTWDPPADGTYTLEIYSFNVLGKQSDPVTIHINILPEDSESSFIFDLEQQSKF